MTTLKSPWAGADLSPLMYESEESVVLRFAWRNAMQLKLLKTHFSARKGRFQLDNKLFSDQTGFFIQPIPELDKGDIIWGTFLCKEFRYCPLCLECCYHSYLHQCIEIQCCPLHYIALSSQCHSCGSPTPSRDVFQRLYTKPYFCNVCNRPLCGVPPQLDAHLDLRAISTQIEIALKPYDLWWRAGGPRRSEVLSMLTPVRPSRQSSWCDVPAFLRSVARSVTEAPAYIAATPYPASCVVQLRWHQRIRMGEVSEFFGVRVSRDRRLTQPNAIYRCTLRLLQRWIELDGTGTHGEILPPVDCLDAVRASPYMHRALALALMRRYLEGSKEFENSTQFTSARDAFLKIHPVLRMGDFNDRTSRLGWRAFFLATYASWYECIQNGTVDRIYESRRNPRWDGAYLFFSSRTNSRKNRKWINGQVFNADEAAFDGMASFLRVPGMPTNPFKIRTDNSGAPEAPH